jgi:hypothetical protein
VWAAVWPAADSATAALPAVIVLPTKARWAIRQGCRHGS